MGVPADETPVETQRDFHMADLDKYSTIVTIVGTVVNLLTDTVGFEPGVVNFYIVAFGLYAKIMKDDGEAERTAEPRGAKAFCERASITFRLNASSLFLC